MKAPEIPGIAQKAAIHFAMGAGGRGVSV